MNGKGIRLQKVLAQAGVASRRAAEEMIRRGRVQVNGLTVTEMGVSVDPRADEIRVDNRLISLAQPKLHILFYKPKHCVTTLNDPQGRTTVLDFLPNLGARLYPVGRLDFDAEGLLLITNDGPLAHRLQHPRYGVPKVYEVKVQGHPDDAALNRLRSGVDLEEGRTAPAGVSVLRVLSNAAWLKIVLHQGWYRQIKRMGEKVGHPVLQIKRVAYGPLELGNLAPGAHRPLSRGEVKKLYRMVHFDEEKTEVP
jgi:23S rRNA pseudouridine2605 synthase